MRIWGPLSILLCLWGVSRADDKLAAAREHYRAAAAAYEVGQFEEAVKEFSEAYKLKNDPTILFNLAQAQRLAGHKAEALREYRMYLSKVPDAPNRSEVERRIAELERPADDPDSEFARRFESGQAHYQAGEYEAALADFERAKKLKPTPSLELSLGRSYDRLGKTEQALAAYHRYVESTPTPTDAAEVRARIGALEKPAPAGVEIAKSPPAESPPKRKPWVVPVAIVAGVVVVGLAVGLGAGLGVSKKEADPTATLGAVHWK